jgi:hypothetical protein
MTMIKDASTRDPHQRLVVPRGLVWALKPLGPQLAEAPLFASKHINLSDRNVVGTGPGTLILLMASCALC